MSLSACCVSSSVVGSLHGRHDGRAAARPKNPGASVSFGVGLEGGGSRRGRAACAVACPSASGVGKAGGGADRALATSRGAADRASDGCAEEAAADRGVRRRWRRWCVVGAELAAGRSGGRSSSGRCGGAVVGVLRCGAVVGVLRCAAARGEPRCQDRDRGGRRRGDRGWRRLVGSPVKPASLFSVFVVGVASSLVAVVVAELMFRRREAAASAPLPPPVAPGAGIA